MEASQHPGPPSLWPIRKDTPSRRVQPHGKSLRLFQADKTKVAKDVVAIDSLDDASLDDLVGEHADTLREDVELIEGVYDAWDPALPRRKVGPGVL